jgi:hypothetical protein
MPITDGRGDDKKKKILEKYKFRAAMHAPLLNGKAIRCVCGDQVTGNFYQFDVIDPSTNKIVDTLYAGAGGNGCANKLMELSQHHGISPISSIPLFNPLHVHRIAIGGNRGAARDAVGPYDPPIAMAPLNVEIEQAILLTLLCWGELLAPGQAFSEILAEIRQHPERPVLDMRIRSVNTAIGSKRSGGKTLTQMLDAARQSNANLRHYTFPLMREALQREGERLQKAFPSNL